MNAEQDNTGTISYELKKIRREGIPRALEKVEQYRLLNEPMEAESICRDILAVDSNNQNAIVKFVLALTDQFVNGKTANEANAILEKIDSKYDRQYYKAIILERQGKAALSKRYPGCEFDAFEWIEEAMAEFEAAEQISTPENNDAILRWNTCARIIIDRKLGPRPLIEREPILE